VFKFYVAPIILSTRIYLNLQQSNKTCDLGGAGENQAAGRMRPAGRQLVIAVLEDRNGWKISDPNVNDEDGCQCLKLV
jgi:hypothetical protein